MTKRILYIGNNLSNSSFTATYISFFSKVLREERYRLKLASNKDNKLLRLMEMLFLIWNNRKKTDLVLIDTYGAQNFYYAYAIGRLCQQVGLGYIPILHGGTLPGRLRKSPRMSRRLFGNAVLNIAPSAYLHGIFKAEGFENVKIIPNSIDLREYSFKQREPLRPKLFWVRRFQSHYNPLMALAVFEELLKKFPEAELCMVGPEKDGSLARCKKEAEKRGLKVRFPGLLEKREWAKLSEEYDFFINTTQVDNMPISVMEAMALGLPVVSTNVGGLPFLIENGRNGVLVPVNDTAAMAEALAELVTDQEKGKKLSAEAFLKVKNFDWGTVREEWLQVFKEYRGRDIP